MYRYSVHIENKQPVNHKNISIYVVIIELNFFGWTIPLRGSKHKHYILV